MKRSDLEHILRACKSVTGETEFIIVGSQAILGKFPDAPRVLRQSMPLIWAVLDEKQFGFPANVTRSCHWQI